MRRYLVLIAVLCLAVNGWAQLGGLRGAGSSATGTGVTTVSDTSGTPEPGRLYFALDDSNYYAWMSGGYWKLMEGDTIGMTVNAWEEIDDKPAYLDQNIKYDRKGNANEMVWIPRFNWDRTNGFNSSTIHPAFVVNGTAIKGFWVAKYECVVLDSATSAIYSAGTLNTDTHHYIANSQPNVAPRHTITFDAASRACDNMNNGSTITGYHLLTNAEWAAVALWAKDNATMPYGNNNYGRDVDKKHLTGTIITGDTFGSENSRWLTGSGGPTTTHNWVNGIADMNGNLWEWVDGFKVDEGKIYVMGNADTSPTWAGNSFAAAESTWYDTGMWINWDGTAAYCSFSTVGRDSITAAAKSKTFGTTTGADSLLQALAIGPVGSNAAAYGNDYAYFRNDGLRFPFRSGNWTYSTSAGVFILYVYYERSNSDNSLGFRAALIE